ncbi:TRAP transporter small permease [Mesobaculum littorinae]|uniref:TRAP transporter small permease protein n=1 Tax=Mesobaculum littorinae TaxID=2486419 RepID=A0A438AHC8_9RHOB|nr:TRAP transporter small permease subunit [Mesobaculum littorinae]RVV98131.1 TRAP transporter small permease [Mesobaculum littorinae]
MIRTLDSVLEWWSRALMAVAIIAGFAMMIHISIDIVARTVFNSPLRTTNQMVAGYYMIAAAFLPIALLGKRDDHISADVFTEFMSPGVRRALDGFTTLLGILYLGAFTWQSWISADRRMNQGEVLEIPGGYLTVWPGRWLLPIAGASLFLCFLLRFIRILTPGAGPDEDHHNRMPEA